MDFEQVILIFTEVWSYNFHVSRQDFQKAGFFLQQLAFSFGKKTSLVFYADQLAHILVCLKCQDTMAIKTFVFRQNWIGRKVAGMKKSFFTIFDPIWTHILAPKDPNKEFLKQHFS